MSTVGKELLSRSTSANSWRGACVLSSRMMRRAKIIGILAVGLAAATVRTSPVLTSFVSSAQSVRQNFRDLKSSGAHMSTVERLVFSVFLVNTKGATVHSPVPGHRT
jgi:hypothetical protein